MNRLSMQFVSLVLLSGLTAVCVTNTVHHRTLNSTQPITSQPLAVSSSAPVNALINPADGTDPVPAPIPLPHILNVSTGLFAVDGGDPVPAPMPLPGPRLLADGGDPVPAPMPLPGPRLLADGGDPVPAPMPLPGPRLLADGGDPVPAPMPLPGRPQMSQLV